MLVQDVRQALRSLWHNRGVTAVAVACLAFGIGLNTTIFSIVDGVLLKPFPYQDPDRLLLMRSSNDRLGVDEGGISYPDALDLASARGTFSGMAALQFRSTALSDSGGEPERYASAAVSANLFPLLGVAPIAGQGFTEAMDRPGAEGAVLNQSRSVARSLSLRPEGDWPARAC